MRTITSDELKALIDGAEITTVSARADVPGAPLTVSLGLARGVVHMTANFPATAEQCRWLVERYNQQPA